MIFLNTGTVNSNVDLKAISDASQYPISFVVVTTDYYAQEYHTFDVATTRLFDNFHYTCVSKLVKNPDNMSEKDEVTVVLDMFQELATQHACMKKLGYL